jgi:hypothetical protein
MGAQPPMRAKHDLHALVAWQATPYQTIWISTKFRTVSMMTQIERTWCGKNYYCDDHIMVHLQNRRVLQSLFALTWWIYDPEFRYFVVRSTSQREILRPDFQRDLINYERPFKLRKFNQRSWETHHAFSSACPVRNAIDSTRIERRCGIWDFGSIVSTKVLYLYQKQSTRGERKEVMRRTLRRGRRMELYV